ncbi:helix-turn-helix transcriptional regulator [Mucilaginibacter mali]|uniref:Helix-turn-helix transcriptional regulator n=1 Tax=Mucilaginibacter mali TaxID=2740462 RepID=A0A7D4PT91_9SPHI|nr:helix-turn-helix domain-containing protein [Mucilaginibacter mali]QKJ29483.1 helix-turn-helix transcriptional regulator [Mucilaginibacter mali]
MTKKRQADYTCAMEAALTVIEGKWKLKILNQLLAGPARYTDIKRGAKGITEKVLTQQLRELEEDGIIFRTVYPVVPPKVEYAYTELGKELTGIFYALEKWGSHFMTVNNPDGTVVEMDASCFSADIAEALKTSQPVQ